MRATTRPRSDEDIPALAAALVRVHAQDGYPVEGIDDPAAWLLHPRELHRWTAEVAGTPIGQIALTQAAPDDDAARIWQERTGESVTGLAIPVRLFVAPDHRRSGAGRLLMRTAVDSARARGLVVAFDVMLKDEAAIRLYQRLGAQHLANLTHHYGDGLEEPAAVYVVP